MAFAMQPQYDYHYHARALHAATFLLVLLFVLIQMVRSRQEASYEIIDMDPLVPVVKPPQHHVAAATTSSMLDSRYLAMLAEKHGLTRNVSSLTRRVRAVPEASRRVSMTAIPQALSDEGFASVRWGDEDVDLDAGAEITLPVAESPAPGTVDASDLLFGVSTTYDRLTYADDSLIRDWQRWLTDGHGSSNGASIIVVFYNTSIREAWVAHDKLKDVGIDATVLILDEGYDAVSRYLEMIDILLEANKAQAEDGGAKKYLGLVDDEIFFPTPAQLLTKLSAFDAREPYYIGLPSERPDWTVKDGAAHTDGGGAVFLTPSAASAISDLACHSAAETPPFANTTHWDSVLRDCVAARRPSMPLHVLPSFYSPRDALYNMQAATYDLGVSPLALRRYGPRHQFHPARAHLVASACGEACFLQRFRFADGWVLANGHSLTHYPAGFEVVPMAANAALQGAMQYGPEAAGLAVGRGIVLDEAEEQKEIVTWRGARDVWTFLDAVVGADGEVWQVYINGRGGPGYLDVDDDSDGQDSIIVLVWEV